MTPEQNALVADARNCAAKPDTMLQLWRSKLTRCADLIETQAAELATLRAERDAAVERCAAWHEREAIGAMNSLHCGSENSEYRAANRLHDFHKPSADALRALKGGA